MKWKDKKLLARIVVWLVAEVYLNLMGLDNIADYSEFVYERDVIAVFS